MEDELNRAREIPPPLASEMARVSGAELRSLQRHSCPECGGKGEWSAEKQQLVCPYCGTIFSRVMAVEQRPQIVEHDLDAALVRLGEGASFVDRAVRRVQCSNCHGVMERGAENAAQRCDFCGSPELLDYDELEAVIRPESLIPARISKEQAYGELKKFLGSRFFAPSALKQKNWVDRMEKWYVPYWTFDAQATCPWTAEAGYYYTVTVTDSEGRPATRQEIRWESAAGQVEMGFDDVLVSATQRLEQKLLAKIEPFPVQWLVPYETSYVAGWDVEQYRVPLREGAERGFEIMHAILERACGSEVPGDTYRSLRIYPSYDGTTYKHVLFPLWVIRYEYGGKWRYAAVNGATGQAVADYPLSAVKVFFAILLGVCLLGLLYYYGVAGR